MPRPAIAAVLLLASVAASALTVGGAEVPAAASSVATPAVTPATPAAAAPSDADVAFFESKVRPLLVERCYKCHSEAEGKEKGGLTADTLAGLLKGGDNGPSVVPGDPAKSRLIEAVGYKNVDLQMPPKGKLTDAQVADLTEWVKRGAPWPAAQGKPGDPAKPAGGAANSSSSSFDLAKRKAEHWAWQPVKRVDPPAVKDAAWPASDVDRFLLAKLEERGLKPAASADRRTLIRRASFDLTGLPPTPAEVDAFLADGSPDAFAKVVDRLLASPRYGERWARHWLDLVRYAETRGHEFDYDVPNAYQYRDYVIRAFNADVPYDRFVREHLAGDLLPELRLTPDGVGNESVLGTGFWFLNEQVHSPVDIRQDEADRVDNQIDVMGKTFLAVTLGCARCHDHKFDAISAKDYYALAGFLHSSSFRDVRFQNQAHNREAAAKARAADVVAATTVLAALAEARKPMADKLGQYLLAAAAQVRSGEQRPGERGGAGAADDGPTARDLDPVVVATWAEELKAARKDAASPLHPFAVVATEPAAAAGKPGDVAGQLKATLKSIADRPAAWAGGRLVVDYDRPGRTDWMADGLAFGDGPQPIGSVTVGPSADQPVAGVATRGAAVAGPLGAGVSGMVRTPTFAIDKPWLSFRVSGAGDAFVVIDSHRMINGPLHGVSKQRIKVPAGWRTHAVPLAGYVGQRAHVEFTPSAEGAGGATGGVTAGRLAVQWVRLSDEQPPAEPTAYAGANPATAVAAALLADGGPDSLAQLTERFQRLAGTAGACVLATGAKGAAGPAGAGGEDASGCDASLRATLLEWMTSRLDAFGYGPDVRRKVSDAIAARDAARKSALADLRPSATALAMLDGSPVDERLFIRGSHKTPGDVVPRRFLEALDGPAAMPVERGSGRLTLADHVADPRNPLTARVMVNRVWHHLFGRGIVASVDNFGVLGEKPTHPELLDCLADEFVKDGWSVKRLVRRLVLTRAWQMSSKPTDPAKPGDPSAEPGNASAEQADPQNLLLHRANLRRLEAEAIRDEMLSVSGRLDERMFGPSVPIHLTEFMEGRGRPGENGPLDGAGRRSLYVKVRRNFLSPMMLAFDAPQPFSTMGRRSASNVPAQALILMNDPFVVQQAQLWAKRVLAEDALPQSGSSATPERRVDRMYRGAFARPPTEAEVADAVAFLDAQGAELGIEPSKRRDDLRVWADLAHVLMNVKEFVYIP